ncbi:MAG TPA: class I SAM-dependent methyltransferase [Phycisphaerae bacterium]|nr:class I SAM-dependent methyltransferase [Phycisphaerae bacterium]HOJ73520.1 class I SAM-dependent methyltransferase [Phycisphaerae bacterium]HOM51672.1 class I SAM-dependent methyltransferase [Phycisphaerae bacterium]HON65936.1 class I SAM-dependent methyltransferase [Phycisphaerae bacterium]HOQ87771.1 class I SAM-dependent methyltransferase [Phycisphaerae bacterium]
MWIRDEYTPTLHEIAWLASEEGQAACDEMAAGHPADTPTAISRWRERLDAERVTAAWRQVLLRQAARTKFSRADRMIFDRIGVEQSTDEVVATHKARRFAGCGRIADLCCGIGGDTLALAAHAPVIAVDISGPRSAMAEHNAGVYGRRAEGVIGDVELTHPDADAAHIDPDRRPVGRREHELEHGSPDLRAVEKLVGRYAGVAIKLSPGAGFERLPFPAEIELISHHGQCKQAVAWTGRFITAHRRATVLPQGENISAADQRELVWPPSRPVEPGLWLLEPDAAVIRANLVGVLARQLDAAPVDPHIAWLVRERPVSTPFANAFRVIDTLGFNEKKLRPWLAGHNVGSLEIKTRGVAFQPEDIVRRLKLRGDRRAVLLIARIGDKPLAILAERA